MPNALRERMERARQQSGRSMNSEIVERLNNTFDYPTIYIWDSPPSPVTQDEFDRMSAELADLKRGPVDPSGENARLREIIDDLQNRLVERQLTIDTLREAVAAMKNAIDKLGNNDLTPTSK